MLKSPPTHQGTPHQEQTPDNSSQKRRRSAFVVGPYTPKKAHLKLEDTFQNLQEIENVPTASSTLSTTLLSNIKMIPPEAPLTPSKPNQHTYLAINFELGPYSLLGASFLVSTLYPPSSYEAGFELAFSWPHH
jgi:hypothetical protein